MHVTPFGRTIIINPHGGNRMGCIKDEVIKMIAKMSNDVTIADIMEELYFELQVNRGLQELDEGKGIPHEEVEKRMQHWLLK